jgi:hypothetical protein
MGTCHCCHLRVKMRASSGPIPAGGSTRVGLCDRRVGFGTDSRAGVPGATPTRGAARLGGRGWGVSGGGCRHGGQAFIRAVAARYGNARLRVPRHGHPRLDQAVVPPGSLPHGAVEPSSLAGGSSGQRRQLGEVADGLAFLDQLPIGLPQARPLARYFFKSRRILCREQGLEPRRDHEDIAAIVRDLSQYLRLAGPHELLRTVSSEEALPLDYGIRGIVDTHRNGLERSARAEALDRSRRLVIGRDKEICPLLHSRIMPGIQAT